MDNQELSNRTFGTVGLGMLGRLGVGRRRNLAAALLLGSTFAGLISHPLASPLVPPAVADQPLSDTFFMPANRVARFLGIGYSDGYHAGSGRSNCAILDLPPASAYANQPSFSQHRPAMFAMPAQAYDFSGPTWIEESATPSYQHQPIQESAITFPVQPSLPPQPTYQRNPSPTPPPQPAPEQSSSPQAPQASPSTRTPAPSSEDRSPLPQPELESIPAPNPRQTPASPSDLLPDARLADPPSSKFFDQDSEQELLEGLEDLGNETLQDPLMDDDAIPEPELDLQDASESKAFPEGTPSKSDLDLDLDLDLDSSLDDLELPPATGDEDNLLNTGYRSNPYHPLSSQQYTPAQGPSGPQQALTNRLIPPANNQTTRVYEPHQIAPAVTRTLPATGPKQPRTASRIYEPRR